MQTGENYGVLSGHYAGETKDCKSLGEGIETKVEKSSELNETFRLCPKQ